jgi:hypothetical protein
MFSDESPYVLVYNKKTRIRRIRGEGFNPQRTTASVKHDRKIMVWGCFAAHGVGELHQVDGIMLQDQYRKILK